MPLPLPSLTRELNAAAGHSGFDGAALRDVLADRHPPLLAKIEDDAGHPERFAPWGLSSNREAELELIHPRLLAALCELVNLPSPVGGTANAGLLHTYGYLFSNRRTPFGFKRERWTRPDLERGLGLGTGLLTPVPQKGTLPENVTRLMRMIWLPDSDSDLCSRENRRLSGITVIEEPEDGRVQLLTRIVRFIPPAQGCAVFHAWSGTGSLKFVTVFPVEEKTVERLEHKFKSGPGLVKPRYNGVIPGLHPQGQPGQIRVGPWEGIGV